MIVVCQYCESKIDKPSGAVNRANRLGLNIYCNRTCAGLARRKNKSESENKEHKRLYDIEYRNKNKELIKAKKAEYFKKDYAKNPEKYKKLRKSKYKKHLEYLNTPEYKAYKKEYDKKHRAKKYYGEFWESSILLVEIEKQIPNFEVKQQLQLINKSQKRKRDYEKSKC
jgi:hypothetical protein